MLSRDNDYHFCFFSPVGRCLQAFAVVEVDVNRDSEAVVRRLRPASGLAVVYNEEWAENVGLVCSSDGP